MIDSTVRFRLEIPRFPFSYGRRDISDVTRREKKRPLLKLHNTIK